MKKTLALVLTLVILATSCLSFTSCGDKKSSAKYTVGVCQLVKAGALDSATEGFVAALKQELGDDVEIDLQIGGGNPADCNPIINSFVSKNVDLIMANATPALLAAYNATTTIPILGTSVTDYADALGVTLKDGVVGGNVSGTTDLADLAEHADMILDFYPNVKKVGIIYCSAESNSLFQVQQMTSFLGARNVEVVPFAFADTNELSAVVRRACTESDVIYLPTDNTVLDNISTVDTVVLETNTPVFGGEENLIKGSGLATISISYYDLGFKTGLMAAKILKGEADISTMKIESIETTKLYNKEMCDRLGIKPPEGYVAIEK